MVTPNGAARSPLPVPVMSSLSEVASAIMAKWKERTAVNSGCFLHWLDGDRENCDPSNLEELHPFDVFAAVWRGEAWAIESVDWGEGLTPEEVSFVRAHAWNFCVTYQADGRIPQEPPIDRDPASYEDDAAVDPAVEALVQQGDAAMAAGDFEQAEELYARAKQLRDWGEAPAEGTGEGGDAGGGQQPGGGGPPPVASPRDRGSVFSSAPSARAQQPGQPTRKEEVAARVASRK